MKNFISYCVDMIPVMFALVLGWISLLSAMLIIDHAPVLRLVDVAMILLLSGGSLVLVGLAVSCAVKAFCRYLTICLISQSPEEENTVLRPLDI